MSVEGVGHMHSGDFKRLSLLLMDVTSSVGQQNQNL